MDIDLITFNVMRYLEDVKFAYMNTIDAAIAYYCHKNQVTLSVEEKEQIKDKVQEALKIIEEL